MGLSAVSIVAPPGFAHMGLKWVLTGFQVGPQLGELHRTHVGPIPLPTWARRGIRLDLKIDTCKLHPVGSHVGLKDFSSSSQKLEHLKVID